MARSFQERSKGGRARDQSTATELLLDVASGDTITEIKPLSSRTGEVLWSVRSGRKVIARLPQRRIDALALAAGTAIDDALKDSIRCAVIEEEARRKAFGVLAARSMSRRKLSEKLTRAAFPKHAIDFAIGEMERIGLLDDATLATSIADRLAESGAAGRRLIELKLRQRGFESPEARAAASAATDQRDALSDATDAAKKKLKTLSRLDPQARSRRLYSFLARRGFDSDVCSDVVRALTRASGDD